MDSNAIAQRARDIRNTLGTVALYLETLDRQADRIRILARSDALLKKATKHLLRFAARGAAKRHENAATDIRRDAYHR
jgi:hypothetical protein